MKNDEWGSLKAVPTSIKPYLCSETLFLVRNVLWEKERIVELASIDRDEAIAAIEFNDFKLVVEGTESDGYRILFGDSKNRRAIYHEENPGGWVHRYELLWSGDLNVDGFPDLMVDLYSEDNYVKSVLLTSVLNNGDFILEKLAEFTAQHV